MNASKDIEGREGTPEDHIDQATTLKHAAETPKRSSTEDGVTSDAMNASHLNLLVRLVNTLGSNGARRDISLGCREEASPLESSTKVSSDL